MAAARGRALAAIRLLAAAAWRVARGPAGPETDREGGDPVVASARAELGAATVEAAWAEGATMTIEQPIAHARQQLTDIPTT